MIMKLLRLFPMLLLASVTLGGCGDDKHLASDDTSDVLVTVNGEHITQQELDASLLALFGEAQTQVLDESDRAKALQAMVLSRVIAQAMLADITENKLREIEYKANQHKERLLVNEYLKLYAQPAPVTDALIAQYYEEHSEEYGGGENREFELLKVLGNLNEVQRESALKVLSLAGSTDDWESFSKMHQDQGFKIQYSRSSLNPKIHDGKIVTLVGALPEGKTSHTVLIDGRPVVARVIRIQKKDPVPLQQVREDIRKKLLPEQVKKAMLLLQEKLLKDAKVVYAKD